MLLKSEVQLPPKKEAKILFLHGLFSDGERSSKCFTMRCNGYEVVAPPLNNWFFGWAVRSIKLNQIKPNVIVGSSRGGAVALNLKTNLPLILMAPAWKYYGMKPNFKNRCIILHGTKDDLISYKDSIELVKNNPNAELLLVDDDHRLNSSFTHKLLLTKLAEVTT